MMRFHRRRFCAVCRAGGLPLVPAPPALIRVPSRSSRPAAWFFFLEITTSGYCHPALGSMGVVKFRKINQFPSSERHQGTKHPIQGGGRLLSDGAANDSGFYSFLCGNPPLQGLLSLAMCLVLRGRWRSGRRVLLRASEHPVPSQSRSRLLLHAQGRRTLAVQRPCDTARRNGKSQLKRSAFACSIMRFCGQFVLCFRLHSFAVRA